MTFYKYIFSLILIYINLVTLKAITINALTYTYPERVHLYPPLINAFNEYAIENKLNITLKITILTTANSTSYVSDYGTMIDILLNKGSKKYDLYFYYASHTELYGKHFIDLRKWLPEEHINEFSSEIISKSCTYKNKLVGLPVTVDVDVLYSNMELLKKYKKDIPKTWEDLIEIGNHIWNEENKLNKANDLTIYNGQYDESEQGILAIYELINSYRDSNSSPYPDIRSEQFKDALKMMKKLMHEYGKDNRFSKDENTIIKLNNGNAIFLRFLHMPHNKIFETSASPGWKDNVSGTFLSGYNLAISKYINETNIKAAVEVIRFATLKENQKRFVIANQIYSAIDSLYDDEEVCAIVSCNVTKNALPFSVMKFNTGHYDLDTYVEKYKKYIYDYLHSNYTLDETIKKIEDLTKYHSISINRKESPEGFTIFIFFILISTIMILSSVFLFIKKFESQFKILPKIFWLILLIGSLILFSSLLTTYGQVSPFKCKLKIVLIIIGFTLCLMPNLFMLIVNFPNNNRISKYLKNHKYSFIIPIIIFEALLSIILMNSDYKVADVIVLNGENFQKCQSFDTFGKIIFILSLFLDGITIIFTLLLIFLEWNITETYSHTRLLLSAMLMDILSIIVYISLSNVKSTSYKFYDVGLSIIIIILAITNYIFIFVIRIVTELMKKKNIDGFNEEEFIKKNQEFNNNIVSSNISIDNDNNNNNNNNTSKHTSNESHNNSTSNSSSKKQGSRRTSDISNKLLNYHYRSSAN